jgi:hypothetical protein
MDKNTQILWILWIVIYIFNIIKYIRNPVNFSYKKLFNITYHNLYFVLEILILISLTKYTKYLFEYFPPLQVNQKNVVYLPIIIGFLILFTYKRTPIKDNTKFILPPENISKGLTTILIISIICITISLFMTQNKYLYVILAINIYFLYNNYNFYPCIYNLPNTFNK